MTISRVLFVHELVGHQCNMGLDYRMSRTRVFKGESMFVFIGACENTDGTVHDTPSKQWHDGEIEAPFSNVELRSR